MATIMRMSGYLGNEAAVEADNEWVVSESEDVALGKDLFHLVAQDQVMFEEFLHGKQMTGLLVTDQIHTPGSDGKVKVNFEE